MAKKATQTEEENEESERKSRLNVYLTLEVW
jgi:hypothetical protein